MVGVRIGYVCVIFAVQESVFSTGWLSSTFLQPDKALERTWAVIHGQSSKGPLLSFYQDQHKETRVLRREKVELLMVRAITRLLQHPKHPHCFTLKLKGRRNRFLFNCDTRYVSIATNQIQAMRNVFSL